ncbi:hypothetical protein QL285_065071 [Trifolium repens]|nr:hypothetical protein QL285_065071 [Trifolium repens]
MFWCSPKVVPFPVSGNGGGSLCFLRARFGARRRCFFFRRWWWFCFDSWSCFVVLFPVPFWCPDLLCKGEDCFGFCLRYLGVAIFLLGIGSGYITPPPEVCRCSFWMRWILGFGVGFWETQLDLGVGFVEGRGCLAMRVTLWGGGGLLRSIKMVR